MRERIVQVARPHASVFYRDAFCQCGRLAGGYDVRDLVVYPSPLFTCPGCGSKWSEAITEEQKRRVEMFVQISVKKDMLTQQLLDINKALDNFRKESWEKK